MNTNKPSDPILDDTPQMQPQITETPEKAPEPTLWDQVKRHGKPIIAVIGIAATLGILYGIRNKRATVDLLAPHKETANQVAKSILESVPEVQVPPEVLAAPETKRAYTRPTEPFKRTMATWKRHSAAKAAQAAELGIALEPYETLVDFSNNAA